MASYDAFISYRHSELDMWAAKRIHKGLETFKVPGAVQKKTGKRRIERVFRDQEELPIGSDLNDNISGAIARSQYLLVICSPRTPESYWVNKEIETFIALHDRYHVLAILIEGEPDESFPAQLLVDEKGNPVEPLAADIRGETPKERKKKLKTELLRLAAPILGCSYDDLRQRHRERKIKQIAGLVSGAAALIAVLGISFGIYNAKMASEIAIRNEQISEQNEQIKAANEEINKNYRGKLSNQSKYLADTSLSLFNSGDRRAAVLVAMEALPEENDKESRPFESTAQFALSKALYSYNTGSFMGKDRILTHDTPISKMAVTADKKYLLSSDQSHQTYLWDIEGGKLVTKIKACLGNFGYRKSVVGTTEINDSIYVANDTNLICYDLSGEEIWSLEIGSSCQKAIFDEENGLGICMSLDKVFVVSLNDRQIIKEINNISENSYSPATSRYKKETGELAIAHYISEGNKGEVGIIDINTGAEKLYSTPANSISEVDITDNGNLFVICESTDDLFDFSKQSAKAYLCGIESGSGKILWMYEDSVLLLDTNATSAQLKSLTFNENDAVNSYVYATFDNHLVVLDEFTGREVSTTYFNGGIEALYLSRKGDYAYVAENNGNVNFVEVKTGKNLTQITIKTDIYIRDCIVSSGVVAAYQTGSPDILLMKYHDGKGKNLLASAGGSISSIEGSPEGNYFLVRVSSGMDDTLEFYESATGKLLSSFTMTDYISTSMIGFIDETHVAINERHGNVSVIDISNGREELYSLGDEEYYSEHYISDNNRYIVLRGSDRICVFDAEAKNVIWSGDLENRILDSIINENGDRLYISTEEGSVILINLKDNKEDILVEGYPLAASSGLMRMAIDKTGQYLAIVCQDDILRVIDTTNGTVNSEIKFVCQYRNYIHFINDKYGIRLIMQSDDYYIKVFDVWTNDIISVSSEQWNMISSLEVNEDNSTMALITSADMLLVDSYDFQILAEAENGRVFDPYNKRIISFSSRDIYAFPYYSCEELMNQAREDFPGEELSSLERMKYHVD